MNLKSLSRVASCCLFCAAMVGACSTDPPFPERNNQLPLAAPGSSQQAQVGQVVTLDGSRSIDPDGEELSFVWTLTTPASSGALLSSPNQAVSTFTPDTPGEYVATLVVSDGVLESSPATVRIQVSAPTQNTPPVADAGVDRQVLVGQEARLSGAASSDPDGDLLSYQWSIASTPEGATVSLSGSTTEAPSFVPNVPGPYSFRLVVNDGEASSTPAQVTLTAGMSAIEDQKPVAKPGANRSVEVGTKVLLDAGASADPEGNPLTYAWQLTAPNGSSSMLDANTGVKVSFTPDVRGAYEAQLVVNDGALDSLAATVVISATKDNRPPEANAGLNQTVIPNTTVQLDGSVSLDPDGDPLSYTWVLDGPQSSNATLSDPTIAQPTFVADVEGTYVLTLTVHDGEVASQPATVTIDVASVCVLFSEYIEGSSNNKAYEIYNCGTGPVDLSRIGVCLRSNANATCGATTTFSAVLASNEVYVVCKDTTSIGAACNVSSGTTNFNGNDRLVLFYDQDQDGRLSAVDEILDAFGQTDTPPADGTWQDITARRCTNAPFDGLTTFTLEDFYTIVPDGLDDFSNLGVAPTNLNVGCP